MRHSLILCLLLPSIAICQTKEWVWIGGDSIANQHGSYGQKLVPASTNWPGARCCSTTWTDTLGRFWLFGGGGQPESGSADYLNDLWMYNPSSKVWTWMSGQKTVLAPNSYGTPGLADPNNQPAARVGGASFVDNEGNIWLFGGYGNNGTSGQSYWDLWKYDVNTNLWTFFNGAVGSSSGGGYFGTKGVESPLNFPPYRRYAVSWVDNTGDFWLFGASGSNRNDLWRYRISTGMWTWIAGDSLPNKPGEYGIKGVAATSNTPCARGNSARWKDKEGNL